MMLSRQLIGAVLIAVCSGLVGPAPPSVAATKIDPKDFLETASERGVAEIELARIAIDKGSAPVQEFAQRMIKDHRATNLKLKAIAEDNEIGVSDEASLVDKARKINLEIHSARAFDKAYVENQIRAHEETIELFERAASSGEDDLGRLARETLPTLRQHLGMARELLRRIDDEND